MPATRTRTASTAPPALALVVAVLVVGAASHAQTQPVPPTAAECSDLIRRAQDEKQRQKMTREELVRTSLCLSLLKKVTPVTDSAPLKIFKD